MIKGFYIHAYLYSRGTRHGWKLKIEFLGNRDPYVHGMCLPVKFVIKNIFLHISSVIKHLHRGCKYITIGRARLRFLTSYTSGCLSHTVICCFICFNISALNVENIIWSIIEDSVCLLIYLAASNHLKLIKKLQLLIPFVSIKSRRILCNVFIWSAIMPSV